MAPDGKILIHDFVVSSDRTGPKLAALWQLQHTAFTPRASSLDDQWLEDQLTAAGFSDVSVNPDDSRYDHAGHWSSGAGIRGGVRYVVGRLFVADISGAFRAEPFQGFLDRAYDRFAFLWIEGIRMRSAERALVIVEILTGGGSELVFEGRAPQDIRTDADIGPGHTKTLFDHLAAEQ